MHRITMFCRTQEELNRNKVPERMPETMTLQEYERLKSLNSLIGDTYQQLGTNITLGYIDYSQGLKQQDELLENLNKVRRILRHFENEMKEKHGTDSGLNTEKLHVYESQGLGPFHRVTIK